MATGGLEVVDIDNRGQLLVNGQVLVRLEPFLQDKLGTAAAEYLHYPLPHRRTFVVAEMVTGGRWQAWLIVDRVRKSVELLPHPARGAVPDRKSAAVLGRLGIEYRVADYDIHGHFLVQGPRQETWQLLTIPRTGPYSLVAYANVAEALLVADGVLTDRAGEVSLEPYGDGEPQDLGILGPDDVAVTHFGSRMAVVQPGDRIVIRGPSGENRQVYAGVPIIPAGAALVWQHDDKTYRYDGQKAQRLPYIGPQVELDQVLESRTGDVFIYGTETMERKTSRVVYQNGKQVPLKHLTGSSLVDDSWARAQQYWEAAAITLRTVLSTDLMGYVRTGATWAA